MLPMRRDTRSKLQKDSRPRPGSSAKAAAAAAATPPISISTRTGWPARTRSCCTAPPAASAITASVFRPAGHDANHARWHGPYATLAEAREASLNIPGVLIRSECKCI